MTKSPYLQARRLGEVIAAIQVLATYKFYRLDVAQWADRITGNDNSAGRIETVLREHPEFFQVTDEDHRTRAALVARRSFTRSYDVDAACEIPKDEAMARRDDPARWDRLSRRPLSPDETAVLLQTAVSLHAQAVEQHKAARWWVPIAVASIGFIGGLAAVGLGATLGGGG